MNLSTQHHSSSTSLAIFDPSSSNQLASLLLPASPSSSSSSSREALRLGRQKLTGQMYASDLFIFFEITSSQMKRKENDKKYRATKNETEHF